MTFREICYNNDYPSLIFTEVDPNFSKLFLPYLRKVYIAKGIWIIPLEKKMATHSSILAWRIPWREELGRLQSAGSHRVGHDWMTSFSLDSRLLSYFPWTVTFLMRPNFMLKKSFMPTKPSCKFWILIGFILISSSLQVNFICKLHEENLETLLFCSSGCLSLLRVCWPLSLWQKV